MATDFEIPINSDNPSFKIRLLLDEIELVLLFNWNDRMSRWYLSTSDSTENPLLMGQPLHINMELWQRFKITGLPQGKLILFDMSKQVLECGRDDLGDRCRLIYRSEP